jgi:ligand-binding SRPBCC domain-containing protein
MPTIRLETPIGAPIERCFDLARDVATHQQSFARSSERVVAGPPSGLLGLGDSVTWEGTHFGIRQRLTARITELDRPRRFVDEMVQGAFEAFTHVHEFVPRPGGTLMVDLFHYTAPFGLLGRLADAVFLHRYMERLLRERCRHLKWVAEAGKQP